MTPMLDLQDLIASVRTHAPADHPVQRLATAVAIADDVSTVADRLLSHYVDECRRAGHSWAEISTALGVTRQAVHKRFAPTSTPALDRFTNRARSALSAAAHDARSLGHNYIGTEHILLGLYEPAGGVAARILDEAKITRAHVETEIFRIAPRRPTMAGPDLPFTPRSNQVLTRAATEALAFGHNYIGTEHILLSLLGDPESVATKILVGAGLTNFDTRQAIVAA